MSKNSKRDIFVEFDLPTSRNFIKAHPCTYIANLHSDTSKIGPTWTKITTTPWENKAILCGGYGRRMINTSISNDAPENFVNPERVPMPSNRMNHASASIIGTRVPSIQEPNASSYVLPGGESILATKTSSGPLPGYRTFTHGKQSYIDNTTKSAHSPFDWNPGTGRQSTGRQSERKSDRSDLFAKNTSESGRNMITSRTTTRDSQR